MVDLSAERLQEKLAEFEPTALSQMQAKPDFQQLLAGAANAISSEPEKGRGR